MVVKLNAAEPAGRHGDDSDRLAEPLAVNVVEGVLQDAGHGAVVLGADDHDRVGFPDRGGEGLQAGGRVVPLVETFLHDGKVEVRQVEEWRVGARAGQAAAGEAGHLDGLASAANGAEEDGDAQGVVHGQVPRRAGAPLFNAPRSTLPRWVRGRSSRRWMRRGIL